MSEIDAMLDAMVRAQDAVGVVAGAADDNGISYMGAAGLQDREAGLPMRDDSVFYIASMTKAITSIAALQCVERGELELDAPIDAVLPCLADAPVLAGYDETGSARYRRARKAITLRHLLSHTSGLAYTTWNTDLFAFRQRLPEAAPVSGPDLRRSAPLIHDPGERWEYSTSTDFAGLAVEAVTGLSLGAYFERHILAPLGMVDTRYVVQAQARNRLAARYLRGEAGHLDREPPEPEATFFGGGGGLFSTAGDYLRFMAALLRLQFASDVPALISEAMFAQLCENQIGNGIGKCK
jgi:methyl acetate hydrolase